MGHARTEVVPTTIRGDNSLNTVIRQLLQKHIAYYLLIYSQHNNLGAFMRVPSQQMLGDLAKHSS